MNTVYVLKSPLPILSMTKIGLIKGVDSCEGEIYLVFYDLRAFESGLIREVAFGDRGHMRSGLLH